LIFSFFLDRIVTLEIRERRSNVKQRSVFDENFCISWAFESNWF